MKEVKHCAFLSFFRKEKKKFGGIVFLFFPLKMICPNLSGVGRNLFILFITILKVIKLFFPFFPSLSFLFLKLKKKKKENLYNIA